MISLIILGARAQVFFGVLAHKISTKLAQFLFDYVTRVVVSTLAVVGTVQELTDGKIEEPHHEESR
jgi:hypothetical protein